MKSFAISLMLSLYFTGGLTLFGPDEKDLEPVECMDFPMSPEPCYRMKEPNKVLFKALLWMMPVIVVGTVAFHRMESAERAKELQYMPPQYQPVDRGPKSEGNLVNLWEYRTERYRNMGRDRYIS